MKELLDIIFPTLSDELIIVISLIIGLLVTASLILFLVKKISPKTNISELSAKGCQITCPFLTYEYGTCRQPRFIMFYFGKAVILSIIIISSSTRGKEKISRMVLGHSGNCRTAI